MLRALYTSSNSMLDQQLSIDSMSNNIANINTVGFKKTRVTFSDIISQTIRPGMTNQNPMQVGLGSKVASTDVIMEQGTPMPTDIPTNVAIEGQGFFTIQNPDTNSSNTYLFTRAGNFTFDAEDNLVDPEGNKVIGWLAGDEAQKGCYEIPQDPTTGIPTGDLQPINIKSFQTVPAVQSTYIRFKANLNGGSDIKEFSQADTNSDFSVILNNKGESLGLKNGDNFKISYDGGTTWKTYAYGSDFTTLNDLVNKINSDLSPNASAAFENGKIKITNSSADNISISIQPAAQTNDKFLTFISALDGTIQPQQSKETQTFTVPTHTIESSFYDELGSKHTIDIVFKKASSSSWGYTIELPDNDGTVSNNTGTLSFDADGGLNQNTQSPTVSVTLNGSTNPISLMINMWNTDSGTYEGNKYSGLTQFSLPSGTSYQTSDGSEAGELEKVSVGLDGTINAKYSNGISCGIAKLAISKFTNPQGLKKVGNTMFGITANADAQDILSSKGYIGVANEGGRGSVLGAKLEMSNVNLAEEFSDMIVYQRGFQANAKGVTTADEIIQTAIQLKR